MTEEKKFTRSRPARLTTVRSLSENTEGPVRILGIVLESQPGMAVVQDIFDDVDKAKQITVLVEGTLETEEKYLLIGDVTERKDSTGTKLILAVSLIHKISSLDIQLFKQVLEMEDSVIKEITK